MGPLPPYQEIMPNGNEIEHLVGSAAQNGYRLTRPDKLWKTVKACNDWVDGKMPDS